MGNLVNQSRNKILVAVFAVALLGVPRALRAFQAPVQPAASNQVANPQENKKTEKETVLTNPAGPKRNDHDLEIEKIDPETLVTSDIAQDQALTVSGATDGETLNISYNGP